MTVITIIIGICAAVLLIYYATILLRGEEK